jgi:hypothetical protein
MNLSEEVFARIAKRTARANFETVRCPDQLVGFVTPSGVGKHCRLEPARDASPAVVLILESPHVAEFEDGRAVGPANGRTGENIKKHLLDVCPALAALRGEHALILVNAVQYQCSLGATPAEYRDLVFREAWASGGKEDFESRLRRIVRPGDVLINACTTGKGRPALRELVEQSVETALNRKSDHRMFHPATWGRLFNTARKYRTEISARW